MCIPNVQISTTTAQNLEEYIHGQEKSPTRQYRLGSTPLTYMMGFETFAGIQDHIDVVLDLLRKHEFQTRGATALQY